MRIDFYRNSKPIEIITAFNSLSASLKWRGAGSFELQIANRDIYRNLQIKTDFLLINGEGYLLENKTKSDTKDERSYILSGRHINALLSWRVSEGISVAAGENYEDIAAKLINDNFINPTDNKRKVSNLVIKNNGITKTAAESYELEAMGVDEMLNKLLSYGDLGYHLSYDVENEQFVFEVLEGRDLSSTIVFGSKYNNIAEIEIYEESEDYKNVGYSFTDGATNVYGEQSLSAWQRREMVSNGDNASEALAKAKEVLGANFEVKQNAQYLYEVDYKLGDKVSFIDYESNLQSVRAILEVEQFWEETHDIALTFGDNRPTIIDKLKK